MKNVLIVLQDAPTIGLDIINVYCLIGKDLFHLFAIILIDSNVRIENQLKTIKGRLGLQQRGAFCPIFRRLNQNWFL